MLIDLRIHSITLYIYPIDMRNLNKKNRQIAVLI